MVVLVNGSADGALAVRFDDFFSEELLNGFTGFSGPDRARCGCSSMVEQKPSKLTTRVRFPSPAPDLKRRNER